MRKILLAAVAATAFLSSQAMADVIAPDRVQSDRVHVGSVNYEDPAQVHALYARITDAARRVCIDQSADHVLSLDPPDRDCINHVVAEAVGKISQPRLTAVYESQGPATLGARRALAGNDQ